MTDLTLQTIVGSGGGGGGCFRKGSLVQLNGGKTIAIEKLKAGDKILSFDEKGHIQEGIVEKLHIHEDPQPLLRVKFWRGEVSITPNHWVLNQYGNFCEIGRLTIHDAIVDGMGHLRPIIDAEFIGSEPVYNLTVTPHHTFICNDVRVHNGGHRELFPVIRGAGGGGDKKGGGGAVEDADTIESKAMISVLDLIGEGEIGGLVRGAHSIYLNETPLQNMDGSYNFKGISWDTRNGTQGQTPIEGFSDIATPYTVGTRVRADTPVVVAITNPNADYVRAIVTIPSLMTTDADDGDMHGATVQFRFDISVNGGSFYDLSGTLTISQKSRSRFQAAYLLKLPKPGTHWSIRMVRLTPDSTTALLVNETYFDSYVELVNSRLSYPNSALVGVRIDSSQFSQIPRRAYYVRGLYIRVPSNYNAATHSYSGVWDGTFNVQVSSSPAWILYDILTNGRYGLGQFLTASQIDKAMLYKIGRYCDEMVPDGFGGFEPRFTVNTVIQTQEEAYKIISNLTSAFRGMGFWLGGMVSFTQDAPTDPSMIFSPANVIDGLFNYSGSARKDRHSVAHITWNDPTENYKQKIEYVEDPELITKYGIRKTDMVAFGCTSRGMAVRAGRWLLYTEKEESDLIQFSVGIDAAMVLPGEVVRIQDPHRTGKRMGGRIVSATSNSVVLDSEITLAGGGAMFSARLPDGSFVDRPVVEGAGNHTTLTFVEALPTLPLPGAMWLVSEENLKPLLARVINIAQGDNPNEFVISAMEHNPSKYNSIEHGWALQRPKTSTVSTKKVNTPTNFTVTETEYQVAPGVIGSKLIASWECAEPNFEVRWRRIGKYLTNWKTVTTTTPSIELENVRKSEHEFQLVAINGFGLRSPVQTLSYTVLGKTTAPGDVKNFKVTNRTSDLLITWDPITDISLKGYEVRVGPSWDTSEVLIADFKGTMITHDQDVAGTYFYHIRSYDTSGNPSDNVTTFKLILDPPSTVQQFDAVQFSNRLEFRWKANPESDIIGYEIREGSSWSTSMLVTKVTATTYTMPAGSVGDRQFWIKAIGSPGIYSTVAAFVTTAVAQSSNINLVWETNEGAAAFPKVRHYLTMVADDLVMEEGATRSEYIFDVNLADKYRAQNTLFGNVDSLSDVATQTWEEATYTWDSPDASRQWVEDGSLTSVSASFQIAPEAPLRATEVDGWRLAETLTSVNSIAASESIAVTYGNGRYGKGVMVTDLTSVSWSRTIPALFNTTFWLRPQQIVDGIYWRVTGPGGIELKLGYSTRDVGFYLEDHLLRRVKVPFTFDIDDRLCIGIVQTGSERKLLIGNMSGGLAAGSELYEGEGNNYTSLHLY